MSKERIVCPHCGAAQKGEATVCDLCGSPLDGSEIDEAPVEEVVASAAADKAVRRAPARRRAPTADRGGFCVHCGSPYPVDARFCGSCGEKIVALEMDEETEAAEQDQLAEEGDGASAAAEIPHVEPKTKRAATDRELGRQVLLVVGAAIVLIVALFVITAVSRSDDSATSSGPTGAATQIASAPLSPDAQGAVESLRAEIDALSGDEKISKLRELADFLISHGRWDLAADAQKEIAESTGEESDWVRSGNLYYDWMDGVEADAKAVFAKRAIESYQAALQINPDNLDVRTDMAIAYMFDPDNSVQAIAQTNMVLEADSLHIQANFNRGIMLLRINRFEDAAFQFNKVKRIVADPQNPIYQRAESALEALQQAGM
ncbi:MAG: zinc ribbon domain-containing protein [Rhodothermales bacterium]|nr:zinc ribbon domain-containing protein [Rhodothermales bacterium]